MCGICGIVDFSGKRASEAVITKMCSAMRHRGPDGKGVYIGEGHPYVGLGHRRLSIIDLSQNAKQPMSNEDDSIWLILNGEIYNYKELRADLEKRGHFFKSQTDSETIIHLYEEYGNDCLKYLRGMFAFAIWDRRNKSLLLARDRVGKKPLLYSYNDGLFSFASEFLPLLSSGLIRKDINQEAVYHYLNLGYIPAPMTIYKGVFKLLPAQRLTLKEQKLNLEQYWRLDYSPKLRISEIEAEEEALRLLKESVKIRMHSDVPLGAFLSGGLDSSAVVALMSELSGERIKTFSIGFQESGYNELRYASIIAKKFNTEHNEFIVKPRALEILPLLVEHYGEPYADSSCIPAYYVARETKKFVTVALNGDGGDESFAGYQRYLAMLAAEKIPIFLRNILSNTAHLIPGFFSPKNSLARARRFLEAVSLPIQERYMSWVSISGMVLKNNTFTDNFLNAISLVDPVKFINPFLNDSARQHMVDALLYTDVMTYLPNDLLVKVDITSMANSLEARSPFLDHKLMEFAARLPAGYKSRRISGKYILKKAMRGILPRENLYRKKMGFGVPIGRWLRDDLRDYLKENLFSQRSLNRGYLKPEAVKYAVRQHTEGKRDYASFLWALLMLELWHQRFMD